MLEAICKTKQSLDRVQRIRSRWIVVSIEQWSTSSHWTILFIL